MIQYQREGNLFRTAGDLGGLWENAMKIMLSACLAGEMCKYSGGNNRNEKAVALFEGNEIVKICPEVMGGLPTPRSPAEIRNGVVVNREGKSVDREFRLGAERALEIARREKPDLIVLQSRSPSCGVKQRYDGTFTGTLTDGPGVTAELLMKHGFRVVDIEDLDLSEIGSPALSTEDPRRDAVTYAEKNRELYLRQKRMLGIFLENGAITKKQYEKSLGDLTEKMGMEDER